jgi:hypothetical protein
VKPSWKSAGITLLILTFAWLAILITDSRVLIGETKIEPGRDYLVEGYGNLGEGNHASLVCRYFTGRKTLTTVFWYAPNNIMGKDACPFIDRG